MAKQRDAEIVKLMRIDPDIDSYQGFIPEKWHQRPMKLADANGRDELTRLLMDLYIDFQAGCATMGLPTTIIRHLKSFHDEFISTGRVKSQIQRLLAGFIQRLRSRIPELTADPKFQTALQGQRLELEQGLFEVAAADPFPLEETWKSYCHENEFGICVFGTMRAGYVACYNAYETFVVHLLKKAANLQSLRVTQQKFKETYRKFFEDSVWLDTWENEELEWARCSRHALSHAGGRETSDLKNLKRRLKDTSLYFEIEQGFIQVWPKDAKRLLRTLTEAARTLAIHAAKSDKFYRLETGK